MNKYRNKKVIVDGEEFDSKKEGNRYKVPVESIEEYVNKKMME